MNPDNNKIILNKIQVKIKNIIFTYIKIIIKVNNLDSKIDTFVFRKAITKNKYHCYL
jgi:hypothetical protein